MGRVKGSLNKNQSSQSSISKFTLQERIQFLANLIVDKIEEDQKNGQVILKKLNIN